MSDSMWNGIPNAWKQEMWDNVLDEQRLGKRCAELRVATAEHEERKARAEADLAEWLLQKTVRDTTERNPSDGS